MSEPHSFTAEAWAEVSRVPLDTLRCFAAGLVEQGLALHLGDGWFQLTPRGVLTLRDVGRLPTL